MLSVKNNEKFSAFGHQNLNYGKNLNDVFLGIARRQVNPAISVEMSVYDVESFKKSNFGSNCFMEENPRIVSVKKCTCAIDKVTCPSHINSDRSSGDGYLMHDRELNQKLSNTSQCSSASSKYVEDKRSNSDESGITIIEKRLQLGEIPTELKLSLTSLSTTITNAEEKKTKQIAFEKWLTEKNRQKKQIEEEKERLKSLIIKEKEKIYAAERDNFEKWLSVKKSEEKKKKDELERKKKEKELAELQKAKRSMENELKYRLWLKRKEEKYLERKIQEQLQKFNFDEDKKKRMELSAAAYQEWLKSSKNKPKPIPLNQGIDSLRSSLSVSFINPVPWVPNIENPAD